MPETTSWTEELGRLHPKGHKESDMNERLNTYKRHTYVVQNWNLNEAKHPSSGPPLSLLQCPLQWDQSPRSFNDPGLSLTQWLPFPLPDTCPRCSCVSPGIIQRSARMPPQRSLPWLAQAAHQSLGHQLLSVIIPQFCFLSSSLRTWHNFHNLCVWRFTVYFPFWQMKVLWHQTFCLFIILATLPRLGIHRIWPIDLPNMAQWQIMAFTFANGWQISKEKQYYKTCGNYMKFNL